MTDVEITPQAEDHLENDEIERFIEQAAPTTPKTGPGTPDGFPDGRHRCRDHVEAFGPNPVPLLFYAFDVGDGWEHSAELHETREGSLDGDPVLVGKQGLAPPQYPDVDE